jgi:hypothetical protein
MLSVLAGRQIALHENVAIPAIVSGEPSEVDGLASSTGWSLC